VVMSKRRDGISKSRDRAFPGRRQRGACLHILEGLIGQRLAQVNSKCLCPTYLNAIGAPRSRFSWTYYGGVFVYGIHSLTVQQATTFPDGSSSLGGL
jgi:hypothetical protein